jgi:tetratricopeptide (TPR) repeat protein
MSEASGNNYGVALAKFNLVSSVYAPAGMLAEALECAQASLRHALQADDPFLKGGAHNALGITLFAKGLFLEAEKNLTLALEMCHKVDFVGSMMSALSYLGLLFFAAGRFREAHEYFDRTLALYDRVKIFPSGVRAVQLIKAAAGIKGGFNPAMGTVQNFNLQEIKARSCRGLAAKAMGEIFLHIDEDHRVEAEIWIRKAIEVNEQNRMPWGLADSFALYAEFFKRKGDPSRALENLQKAIEILRDIGAEGWVEKYEKELADI